LCYKKLNNFYKAEESFERCILENISINDSILQILHCFFETKNFEKCLNFLEKYSFQGNINTINLEIECLLKIEDYEKLLKLCDILISKNNLDIFLQFKSFCLFKLKKYNECILNNSILIEKKNLEAIFLNGSCFFELNDYNTAINYFKIYLSFFPFSENVLFI
jgi:tetratricopeptide (TPR) repeat protein